MPDNKSMKKAKSEKNDEFYTSLSDIEAEMKYHKKSFEGKSVLCNCDDPYESNFFKYFCLNFNALKLKKLVCTCFDSSKMAGTEISLFDFGFDFEFNEGKAHVIEITSVQDLDGDGAITMNDIELILHSKETGPKPLKGDGDYASPECMKLLSECDIVVTNPPFSQWIPFFKTLVNSGKQFLIIGNLTAVAYKEVFPYLKDNRVWLGASIHSGDREFRVPDDYPLDASNYRVDENGNKYIRVKGVRWFTNLDYKERHETLDLYKKVEDGNYPVYAIFDGIDVDSTDNIPVDYYGYMGLPVSFIDKYSPEQFELIGIGSGTLAASIGVKKNYRGRTDISYQLPDGSYKCPFSRIIVRRKTNED